MGSSTERLSGLPPHSVLLGKIEGLRKQLQSADLEKVCQASEEFLEWIEQTTRIPRREWRRRFKLHQYLAGATYLSDYPPGTLDALNDLVIQLDQLITKKKAGFKEEALALAEKFLRLSGIPVSEFSPAADPPQARTPRLTVDLARMIITLDGQEHEVTSESALRWVKVLADHAGEWISGKDLEKHDPELASTRTDRWRKFLPKPILSLIDSVTGKGSRIRLT